MTLLGLGTVAIAQDRSGDLNTTVYLVLRAGSDVTEEEIIENLKRALRASGSQTNGEPSIRSVSPLFVEELQSLTEGGLVVPDESGKGPLVIRRLATVAERAYEVKVEPHQVIKKLRVTFRRAGEKEYTPTASGTQGLVLITPGRYAFYPAPNEIADTPTSYQATISEFDKPDTVVEGEWVKGDNYFVVVLRGYRGNRNALIQAIQDKKVVANPFKGVTLGNNLEIVFASLRASRVAGKRSIIDSESNITIRVDTLEDREPARVWIYFPLGEDDLKGEELDRLTRMSGSQLSKYIRSKSPVTAQKPAELRSTDGALWFELPPRPTPEGVSPSEFERRIRLGDLTNLEKKYPRAWKLVVWEFGEPPDTEAILVNWKDKPGRYPFEIQEMVGWQSELQEAIRRSQSPSGKK